MTAAETFQGKNALRRLLRGPVGSGQRRRYNDARQLRRHLLVNGAFGRFSGELYAAFATGTCAAGSGVVSAASRETGAARRSLGAVDRAAGSQPGSTSAIPPSQRPVRENPISPAARPHSSAMVLPPG